MIISLLDCYILDCVLNIDWTKIDDCFISHVLLGMAGIATHRMIKCLIITNGIHLSEAVIDEAPLCRDADGVYHTADNTRTGMGNFWCAY